jgi:alpha-tubulin suppressor-like RCC1 family protein
MTIPGLSSGVSAVTAGPGWGLAIRNGAVYVWGDNTYGELGDGTFNQHPTPVAVSSLSSGATAVASGWNFSLILKSNGVYACGYNDAGELGNTSRFQPTATLVGGMSSGVTAITAGADFSEAIQNGGVFGWGDNDLGRLGDGTTTSVRTSPVAAVGLSNGVTSIAAGNAFTLAVRNGGVYAWGYNGFGQLGDGTTTTSLVPERIDPADLKNIVSVAAGGNSSYALSSDGSLWVWGYNTFGELGLGDTIERLTPAHLLPPAGYAFTSIDVSRSRDSINSGEHAIATLSGVPEPTNLALLVLSSPALLMRRRRW